MAMKDASSSRRGIFKTGLAAAAGGIALAQSQSARRFRGWVSRGNGPGRTTLQDLTLRPITGRQVVVRTEATNLCYSNAPSVLGLPGPGGGALQNMALIQGHGGVGVVESVGPEVRRVQTGDRVCVSGTPQCGSCYQCLRGRADMCQFLGRQGPNDLVPIADMRDGTPVYANSHIGGLAEYMVTFEEWVVPVFTKAAAAELGMVCSCVSVAGLGTTTSQVLAAIAPGSIVAVMGCGPLGLSAVQGARISGASKIIAIDPIRARREMALKVGATQVLDPNVEGDKLVAKVRELSNGPNNRLWAGGRDSGGLLGGAGADFVVEAVGADHAYEMCAPGGHIITTSLPRGNITLPAVEFAIGGRTHHAGQAGGANPMRDIPRFVEMLDSGQYNAKALATAITPIERMLDAYEEVLYRTTITAIMTA
jgi:S-(hydroxymethyl)glutathione dehydrogenase/alcohol dehydrogenase